MTTHELKTWPGHFEDLWAGRKTFESRINDRDFKVGDALVLREWDPQREALVGRSVTVLVTHLLKGPCWGVMPDYVCMSIEEIARSN